MYYTPSRPAAPSHPGGVFPYLYPPVVIVPFIPLALLPFWVAAGIWVTVSLVVAVFGAKTLLNAYGVRLSSAKMLLLAYGIFAFAPTLIWIKLGQVTGIFVGSLCFAAASLERNPDGRFGWLGFVLLPAVVKPPYAVTMAPALNDYRRVLRVAILGIAVIAVSVLLFGIEAHEAYLGVLREGKGWHLDALPISKFSFFVFRPFHVLGSARVVLRGVLLVSLVGYVLGRRSRRSHVERALFALGCAAVPVLHPTVNTLALNALIPAYLIVFVSEFRRSDGTLTVPLLSLVLVQVHPYTTSVLSWTGTGALSPLEPLIPLVPVLQPGLWGVVTLVAFIVYRIERDEGGLPLPEDGSVC
ncbi:glycosyltransferase family 87 protein [Halobacterium sp. CBA1126]|uniref:glycosyltransferase family 87 protein n=1 Tax=Halobacterium sp. CBA1126 TaxID=2668074 RepID=UPI0012F736DD|nr:glycosyltransferase family 87 protein [Halobacterium sp. CBA1126]MUV59513.1 DUF2029 domain-containing protein [Halobacterium sp. CBA1126]